MNQTATLQTKTASQASTDLSSGRVAISPKEFASYFGRSQTWAYRRIYAGDITVITSTGRMMIPVDQLDALVKTAAKYGNQ